MEGRGEIEMMQAILEEYHAAVVPVRSEAGLVVEPTRKDMHGTGVRLDIYAANALAKGSRGGLHRASEFKKEECEV